MDELIGRLVANVGVDRTAATTAVGIILQFLVKEGPADKVQKLIDQLPGAASIVVASPCSGHGFKFAPAIGEILADLASGLTPRHDISRFRIGRFA